MENSYNARCPAVKRLFREAKELHESTEEYYACPLDDNLFEWHFTVRGPVDTEFDGGVYHGRIILPADYPMKPPNIIFLTANGRFETNKKICLSISGHHPETWQPSWSIRTALLAIIGFMPTPANGTIGSLDYTAPERQILAKKSVNYECGECGCISKLLKERTGSNTELQEEAKKVMSECSITSPGDKKANESSDAGSADSTPHKDSATAEDEDSHSRESSPVNGDSITRGATGVQALKTEATSQENLPGTVASQPEQREEILMEGAQPQGSIPSQQPQPTVTTSRNQQQQRDQQVIQTNGSLYNGILSAAICLFIALVLRRIFMLEHDGTEDMEEAII